MIKKFIWTLIALILVSLLLFKVVQKGYFSQKYLSANVLSFAVSDVSFGDALRRGFEKKNGVSEERSVVSPAISAGKEEYVAVADYEQRVIRAIEKSSPTVVSVVISKDVPMWEQYYVTPFGDPVFQDFFGEQIQIPQVRQNGIEQKEVGSGSGFIISSDGLIVTNQHVVSDSKASYIVLLNDGKRFPAKILARDVRQDMAVLKIEARGLPTLSLGDSDTVKIGQTAIAIGNSLGEFRNTASVGIISGLARNITAGGGGVVEALEGVIQTDAAINQGNSGGPLLNLRGEVVGVNVAIAQGAQSVGFAIPINKVKRAIEEVRTTGKISTPYLGIRYIILDEELQKREGVGVSYGAFVRSSDEENSAVIVGSPAEKAGVKEKDIVLEINGKKVTREDTLTDIISGYKVGDILTLKILRGTNTIEFKVTLEQRPNNL